MPVTPEECLVVDGEAWFERDPARRVEVLRRCCTEDIVFMDPRLGRLHGLDAVSDMIGRYIGDMAMGAPAGAPTASTAERRGRSGSGVSVEVVTPMNSSTVSSGTTVWPGSEHFPVPYPRS
jgi:hypothetical protein